jgi:hypothetical protein
MPTDNNTTQETQFVLRRLEEALRLFGKETDPRWFWILVLTLVLAVGFFYVGWMYKRDSRSVGWAWASLLGFLRSCVYAVLAAVFLLPALQTWDRTELHSKVVLAQDVSGSMSNKDDIPTDTMPVEKLLTRQDKIIQFLTDDRLGFIKRLQEKNPVSLYRFGSQVDEQFQVLEKDKPWSTADWAGWLKLNAKETMPEGLNDEEKKDFLKRQKLHEDLVNGTDLGNALASILNREANNMVQATVLFSDGRYALSGRNTQSLQDVIDQVKSRAKRAKVPIFTVAVGEYRQPVSIRITDLQTPEQARPDDKFPVRVEVDGEGLPNRELIVYLDVTSPKGDKRTLEKPFKLSTGSGGPPHAQIEFEIDANQLGAPPTEGRKPELEEGAWQFQARIPKDRREVFADKEHRSEKQTVQIVKKPLRVLLFAGAATRDYQFVRNLLVREVEKHRAQLSICLQMKRDGVVQDVEAERFLQRFPNRLGDDAAAGGGTQDRYGSLSQYDLIIAFDPDWSQLGNDQPEALTALEKWVNLQAGGLIVVAGPVNTFQLARLGNRDKLKPILDLFPVTLQDSVLQAVGLDRPTTDPWRLHFPGANAELEFLKLDEESTQQLAGWDEFFTGLPKDQINAETPTVRGFYNYYPVDSVKASAQVIATFSDPRARLRDNKEQPFLVTMPYGSGKVVYIGAGETWRLRMYREIFFERCWTKLARYVGSGNLTRLSTHGRIIMGSTFTAGQFVPINAQLFGLDMLPLSVNSRPKVAIKPPPGVAMPPAIELEAKPTQGGEWQGWFQGRLRVLSPGEYRLELQIPESGEILPQRFVVKEDNPEMDNTRPDFGQLYQLASEVTDFMPRIPDKETQDEVKLALEGTAARLLQKVDDQDQATSVRRETTIKKAPEKGKEGKEGKAESKETLRFFFDLTTAHLIPKCMVTESKVQRSRGKAEDLWDEGVTLVKGSDATKDETKKDAEKKHDKKQDTGMAYVLILVVSLLSLEWLARKLLKLA